MGGACGTFGGRTKILTEFLGGKLKERDQACGTFGGRTKILTEFLGGKLKERDHLKT